MDAKKIPHDVEDEENQLDEDLYYGEDDEEDSQFKRYLKPAKKKPPKFKKTGKEWD
jgi:hypothetical protein